MKEISYLEAWQLWFSGQQTNGFLLWGVQILWWGRIGKVIQLISALAILVEIIGVERVRHFGNSIHQDFTVWQIWRATKATIQQFSREHSGLSKEFSYHAISARISFATKWISFVAKRLLVFIEQGSFSILYLFFNSFIVEPFAYILERPHIDKVVQIISVLMLLIGFHFDLLAS